MCGRCGFSTHPSIPKQTQFWIILKGSPGLVQEFLALFALTQYWIKDTVRAFAPFPNPQHNTKSNNPTLVRSHSHYPMATTLTSKPAKCTRKQNNQTTKPKYPKRARPGGIPCAGYPFSWNYSVWSCTRPRQLQRRGGRSHRHMNGPVLATLNWRPEMASGQKLCHVYKNIPEWTTRDGLQTKSVPTHIQKLQKRIQDGLRTAMCHAKCKKRQVNGRPETASRQKVCHAMHNNQNRRHETACR